VVGVDGLRVMLWNLAAEALLGGPPGGPSGGPKEVFRRHRWCDT
jgi:hypothetical protein